MVDKIYYLSNVDVIRKLNEVIDTINDMETKALKKHDADGCFGCKYENKDKFEMPCLQCMRNNEDYWRAER